MRFTPMLFFTEANKMIDMGNWKNQKLTECWLRKGEQGGHYSQKRLRQCCEMDDFKYTRLCKALPPIDNTKLPIDLKDLFYYLKDGKIEGNLNSCLGQMLAIQLCD